MRNVWTICQKELQSYFASPVAYILLAAFAALFGYFFWNAVAIFTFYSMQSQMTGRAVTMNINEQIIAPLLANASVLAMFLVPMITMRLFAEENNRGTIELLLTSPLRDWEILLGKWLGAFGMYAALLLFTALNLIFLFAHGTPDWKPVLTGYLGLLLQGGAMLAIGAFLSTLTRNQIVAAVMTFVVLLLLYVFAWVAGYEQATWAKVLAYLSLVSHSESFSKGVIDLKDVVYYLSITFFGLFLTARSLESLRWRS
jgi:ABC-2 type transport system permease protein